jgi:Ca2+-binding EF-hand superfamily protein
MLEIMLNYRAEQLKRNLEQSYDFTVLCAFSTVDDWLYNYIDITNLKRFLVKMGHVPSKFELLSIIRRIDTDGDGKLNLSEF